MSGSVTNSIGRHLFQLSFQICPIVMVDGIAPNILGGMLPIISITESANFVAGLLSGGANLDLDDFFCHFKPAPGGTLIDNQVAMYPFANQTVAANAIVTQPLQIALRMVCPVKSTFGYAIKLATIEALQAALSEHNNLGGTYTILTPSFIYTGCIMTMMRDISGGESRQAQIEFELSFVKPLVTLDEAQAAQSSLIRKITAGVQTDGSWSGAVSTLGNPVSGATPAVVGAGANLAGSGLASFAGPTVLPSSIP